MIQYPSFLDNTDFLFPLGKSTTDLVQKGIPKMPFNICAIIAHYATDSHKLDISRTIIWLQSNIPSDMLMQMKKAMPQEVIGCLEDKPQSVAIVPGSAPIKNSPARKLAAFASMYFWHCHTQFRRSNPNLQHSMAKDNLEYYEFLSWIPGIDIVQRCDPTTDKRLCHTYVFGHHDWYAKINVHNILLTHPNQVLNFLIAKGYKRAKKPAEGQIVVYHTPNMTYHFGKVEHIDSEGIIVTSKFGRQHIYKHRIGLAQYHCGNCVTFLLPPA